MQSARIWKVLALLSTTAAIALGIALGVSWSYARKLEESANQPLIVRERSEATALPVSPLLMRYQLELPGRGEIFPALTVGAPAAYLPGAVPYSPQHSQKPPAPTTST